MSDKIIKVGLLGLGTVGGGVFKILEKFPNIKITKIAAKNIDKNKELKVKDILTENVMNVASDPEISIMIEVIGGVEPAFEAITTAIKSGKHVVTANKELIAKKGSEIFDLANKHNVSFLYEASVAGGIPIIMAMKQSLAANKIKSVAGILNGTTNYILTKMESEKAEFKDVLYEAQKLGYAEADPTSDIDGHDAAYKISILASIAFNYCSNINKIYREGIRNISTTDINYASELGYRIKLIAMANLIDNNKIDVRVHPTLVPKLHPLASINGVTNAVSVCGDAVGEVNFSGPGAGEMPTASSVAGDVLAIVKSINETSKVLPSMRTNYSTDGNMVSIDETINSYYIHILSFDKPGVIGSLGYICGKHGVSLLSVIQKDLLEGNVARIILLTHQVKESAMQAALKEIAEHESTKAVINVIRVFK